MTDFDSEFLNDAQELDSDLPGLMGCCILAIALGATESVKLRGQRALQVHVDRVNRYRELKYGFHAETRSAP